MFTLWITLNEWGCTNNFPYPNIIVFYVVWWCTAQNIKLGLWLSVTPHKHNLLKLKALYEIFKCDEVNFEHIMI